VAPFCHPSVWFGLPTGGLPIALTALTVWTLIVRRSGFVWNKQGLAVVIVLCWAYFTLIRIDGVNADLRANMHWRWIPTAEERFLAEKAGRPQPGPEFDLAEAASDLTLSAGDWPGFRGPDRDGVIRGVKVATDWDAGPPKQLWRQRVGPAWSSVIVIGRRLYTQEQRGDKEAVVCYEAATGKELWVHEDAVRFTETVSGPGPRATPTFAGSMVFTLGATGILNCLDARTGKRYWHHDIAADTSASVPMWGFSGSPLVVKDKVIVFAGGQGDQQLLAYNVQTGDLAWGAKASAGSYASPQLVTMDSQPQCLLAGDHGLTAVEPETGKVLWQYGQQMPGAPRAIQPHLVSPSRIVGTLEMTGLALVEVKHQGGKWKAEKVWATTQVLPEFPDLVVHQGHAYGFDGAVFCCVDLGTGKRRWKQGRYGRGQVMLLADQSLLLVLTEEGEAVLLTANPSRHEEIGRFPAVDGKTWNHPVIAHGRLYVRNAEEMACYEFASP
jgi:hypothetical protein